MKMSVPNIDVGYDYRMLRYKLADVKYRTVMFFCLPIFSKRRKQARRVKETPIYRCLQNN
jgi:hypothetical protein